MKYSLLEELFSDRWQWVRKRSKCLWVRDASCDWCLWVKFTNEELEDIGSRLGTSDWKPFFEGIQYEDWRPPTTQTSVRAQEKAN